MAFHSEFSLAGGANPPDSRAAALRPLGWTELCAQLVAGCAGRTPEAGRVGAEHLVVSFNGSTARFLMRLGEAGVRPADKGEGRVNPKLSAAGKAPGGKGIPDVGAVLAASAGSSAEFE